MTDRVSVKPSEGEGEYKRLQTTEEDLRPVDVSHEDAQQIIGMVQLNFIPSPAQVQFAETLLLTTKLTSHKAVAKKIGVSEKTLYNWFLNPQFRIWVETVRKMLYIYYGPMLDKVLISKAMSGSFKHLELAYTLKGDLQRLLAERETETMTYERMDGSERFMRMREQITKITGIVHEKEKYDVIPPPIRLEVSEPPEGEPVAQ